MPKLAYLQMGLEGVKDNKKLSRKEIQTNDNKRNNYTRMLIKAMNIGKSHGHINLLWTPK